MSTSTFYVSALLFQDNVSILQKCLWSNRVEQHEQVFASQFRNLIRNVDKGSRCNSTEGLTGSTSSPTAQKLSAISLSGSGNSSELYKVRQCKLRLAPRIRSRILTRSAAFAIHHSTPMTRLARRPQYVPRTTTTTSKDTTG